MRNVSKDSTEMDSQEGCGFWYLLYENDIYDKKNGNMCSSNDGNNTSLGTEKWHQEMEAGMWDGRRGSWQQSSSSARVGSALLWGGMSRRSALSDPRVWAQPLASLLSTAQPLSFPHTNLFSWRFPLLVDCTQTCLFSSFMRRLWSLCEMLQTLIENCSHYSLKLKFSRRCTKQNKLSIKI